MMLRIWRKGGGGGGEAGGRDEFDDEGAKTGECGQHEGED